MNDAKIATLDPKLQPLCREFLAKGDLYLANIDLWKDYHLLVTEARRDIYRQAGLYSIGRDFDQVGRSWYVVDKNKIVTHTLESKHLEGLAFDVCLSKPANPAYWPDAKTPDGKSLWFGLAGIASAIGLTPGAFFPPGKEDWDHYQL